MNFPWRFNAKRPCHGPDGYIVRSNAVVTLANIINDFQKLDPVMTFSSPAMREQAHDLRDVRQTSGLSTIYRTKNGAIYGPLFSASRVTSSNFFKVRRNRIITS